MHDATQMEIETFAAMKLPELWARYAEVLGEESRCPNKKYLIRRLTEALEARDAAVDADALAKAKRWAEDAFLATDLDADRVAGELVERFGITPGAADEIVATVSRALDEEHAAGVVAEAEHEAELAAAGLPDVDDVPPGVGVTVGVEAVEQPAAETRLGKLSVEALQALHLELVGRPSSSTNKPYLQWRVRQAQKGRIPTGPRASRATTTADATVEHRVLPLRMAAEQVTKLDEARERLGLHTRMDLFRRALHAYLGEQGETDVAALFAPEA